MSYSAAKNTETVKMSNVKTKSPFIILLWYYCSCDLGEKKKKASKQTKNPPTYVYLA